MELQMKRFNFMLLALILALTACAGEDVLTSTRSLPASQVSTPVVEKEGAGSTALPVTETAAFPTPTAEPPPSSTPMQPPPSPSPTELPAPTMASMSPASAVAAELGGSIPPERDDLRLAIAFRGLSGTALVDRPLLNEPLSVGEQQTFTIPNVVDNTVSDIEAELLAVSENAYFWFDKGPGSINPEQDALDLAAQTFDEIYSTVVEHFGSERSPGIDGDLRLHIVHASPLALCGGTEETADQCYLAGLVNSTDLLSNEIDPRSNEREMFIMNARRFGTEYNLGVLAHEFRHMIEDNHDKSDTDWEVEGSATLAAQLAGLPSGGIDRGNKFLEQPDQQLNSWPEEGTAPYYGQGYIFNRFIYDQLGDDLYRDFATSPLPGFKAIDAVAEENGLDFDGQSLWLDYLVALAIHDDPQASAQFQFESTGLNTATATSITHLPAFYQEQVSQYAADYYEFPEGVSSITFSGAADVPLLGVRPVSEDRFWYAQRANYSNPRLTYALDLSELDHATLNYDIYSDIEQGYDFAYVSVSLDDGRTWIPLEGAQMQGLDPADNPAGSALTDRFYTGRSRQWVSESIDISPYVGQKLLLRFEYVTDQILTYGGLALDNIAIPELDFFDGAEEDGEELTAEGFTRATASIPQTWHLQLITYSEEGPQVQSLPVDSTGEQLLTFENRTEQPSILIVAATAPMTLEKATYELDVD
jgi:hypothetical protein